MNLYSIWPLMCNKCAFLILEVFFSIGRVTFLLAPFQVLQKFRDKTVVLSLCTTKYHPSLEGIWKPQCGRPSILKIHTLEVLVRACPYSNLILY